MPHVAQDLNRINYMLSLPLLNLCIFEYHFLCHEDHLPEVALILYIYTAFNVFRGYAFYSLKWHWYWFLLNVISVDVVLQEEVVQLLPMVNEANAMSDELKKNAQFELALISPQARGLKEGKTEVWLLL